MPKSGSDKEGYLKPHLWLINFIGVIVPRRFRTRWRREWEAELEYREEMLARWDRLDWRNKLELLRREPRARFGMRSCCSRNDWRTK